MSSNNITLDDFNEITLDLSIHRIVNVHCMRDDTNSRKLLITITNDGEIFPLDDTITATYKIAKADGTYIYNPVDEIRDGKIYIDLTEQCLSFAGIAQSEIQLMKEKQIISSMPFNIIVKKSSVNGVIESSSEFKYLLDYIYKSKRYDLLTNEILIKSNENLPDHLRSGDFYLREY